MKTRCIPLITRRGLILTLVLALLPFVVIAKDTVTLNERLIEAANRGDLAMAKALLDKGADVNAKGAHGETPLMLAAEEGFLGQAKLLLERGAKVNAKDNEGRTALMWAATKGHANIVNLLLEKGSDIQVKDNLGLTASKRAQNHGYEEIARLLKVHGAKEQNCMLGLVGFMSLSVCLRGARPMVPIAMKR
jgi:uncharacterized protein